MKKQLNLQRICVLASLCCLANACSWDDSVYNTFVSGDNQIIQCPPGTLHLENTNNDNWDNWVEFDTLRCYDKHIELKEDGKIAIDDPKNCSYCTGNIIYKENKQNKFDLLNCPLSCIKSEYKSDIIACQMYWKYSHTLDLGEDKASFFLTGDPRLPSTTFVADDFSENTKVKFNLISSYPEVSSNHICPIDYSICQFSMSEGAFGCIAKCAPQMVLCDGKCINPRWDENYCGASSLCSSEEGTRGKDCSRLGMTCVDEQCVCAGNMVLCDNNCIDPRWDENFCGATDSCNSEATRGHKCENGMTCVDSECKCTGNTIQCDGKCIDPNWDVNYCGASGTCDQDNNRGMQCGDNEFCYEGKCKIALCKSDDAQNNQCFFAGECINETEHCGEHCMNCLALPHVIDAECNTEEGNEGTCSIKECEVGYHPGTNDSGELECVQNTIQFCGDTKGTAIADCADLENTAEVECTSEGKCQILQCAPGYHVKNITASVTDPGDNNCDNPGECDDPGDNNCDNPGECDDPGDGNCDNPGECDDPGDDNCDNPGECDDPGDNNCDNPGECNEPIPEPEPEPEPEDVFACVADDPDNCGSEGFACAEVIPNGAKYTCVNGNCDVTECASGYHLYGEAEKPFQRCEANTNDNCGTHGNSCSADKFDHATAVACSANGECLLQACEMPMPSTDFLQNLLTQSEMGYHVNAQSNKCEINSKDNCGYPGNKCVEDEHAMMSACIPQFYTCFPTFCIPGYHLYVDRSDGNISVVCEQNSADHCGAHGRECTAPKDGTSSCDNGTCVTSCNPGYTRDGAECFPDSTYCEQNQAVKCTNANKIGEMYICSSHEWTKMYTCPNKTSCKSADGPAECGECINDSKRCTGITRSVCTNGVWSTNECTAPNHGTATCNEGNCGYTCDAGYTDNGKICCANVSNGAITRDSSATCNYTCNNGFHKANNGCAVNECNGSETKCTNNGKTGQKQTCSGGVWGSKQNCANNYSCNSAGTNCGVCINDSKQCSGKIPQTCKNGAWNNGTTCTTNVSNATAVCTGAGVCGFTCNSGYHKSNDGKSCVNN